MQISKWFKIKEENVKILQENFGKQLQKIQYQLKFNKKEMKKIK